MTIRIRTTDSTEAWRSLLLAFSRVNHRLEADLREAQGINLGWYEVMLQLAGSPTGTLRMSDVADGMILSRSATTRLVDRLERDGLVERSACGDDGRGTEVSLTGRGRDVFIEAGRLHLQGIEQYFGAHLDTDELHRITAALERVADANA